MKIVAGDLRFFAVPAEKAAGLGTRVQHKSDVPDLREKVLVNK